MDQISITEGTLPVRIRALRVTFYLMSIAIAIAIVNTTANTAYWLLVQPRLEALAAVPLSWWLMLYTIPLGIALTLGILARSTSDLVLFAGAIVLGMVLQITGRELFQLPGAEQFSIVPPGADALSAITIGAVFWTIHLGMGSLMRKMLRRT